MQPPADVSGSPDPALEKRLAAVNHWQLSGKLAVRTPEQSESAQISWQQDNKRFDIHLSGPAGLKATRIYGLPGDVNFEQGDRSTSADSVEALSEQLVGWPLPADNLTWWVRGIPAANSKVQSVVYTAEGWMAALVQDGWTIHFSNHQAVGSLMLPGRIEAVRGDTKIILVIKEWQVR
ncbi:MAG TPA: lipoprotein insertase outer membrane protein LolB [Pseudomonadales bacterium]|nr:lipoprotein insertase outer membrane protein LolB [Pseudomonadales bacterium]